MSSPLIEVHHLRESRSRRITWMLEELGKDFNAEGGYTVITYDRLPSRLAPPELKVLHPLGKAPVLKDGEIVLIESGAILEYLIETYGGGKFVPPRTDPSAYYQYKQFMHYAEGSAMLPLLLKLYTSRLGDAAAPLHPRISEEIDNHFGYLDKCLEGKEFFVGDELTGADVQMTFAVQTAIKFVGREKFANLTRYCDNMEKRPAYIRAKELHGE